MPFEIIRYNENLLKKEKVLEKYSRGGRFRVCLVYPNTYRAGMASLGFLTVYDIIASSPDFYCDRSFLPDSRILRLYEHSRRKLMGIQSEVPLQEFDIIAFSISYEPDYVNFLRLMELSGIPPYSHERNESHPLIIAGGAAVSINPEIISPFIDVFFIGEAEDSLAVFLDEFRKHAGDRNEFLEKASRIPGIYIPSLYDISYDSSGFIDDVTVKGNAPFPVKRQTVSKLPPAAHSVIITPEAEFSDSFLIEVSRGCPYSCRFCTMGNTGKPYRYRAIENIKESIDRGMELTRHIGLLGAAVGSHPDIEKILDYISGKGGNVSFSSLRADVLSDEIIEALSSMGQKTITLAPEVGSDSLRKSIGKSMTTPGLLKTAEKALNSGFNEIRVYLMYGLPGETEDDLSASVELLKELGNMAGGRGAGIMASINQFVPKPGTPFQNMQFIRWEEAQERAKILIKPFAGCSKVSIKHEDSGEMFLQAFLGRGNRKWSEYLLDNYKKPMGALVKRLGRIKDESIDRLLFSVLPDDRKYPWNVAGG